MGLVVFTCFACRTKQEVKVDPKPQMILENIIVSRFRRRTADKRVVIKCKRCGAKQKV